MSVGSKHWLLQLSSASGSSSAAVVHGPLSANQVCKLVLGSSTLPSDLSSLASPTLESLAALVESGQQHPWRPVREWDELRKILHVLQDPEAKERRRQRKRKRAGPQTWVYVLGLPDDVSVDEIYEHFKTVGAIRDEPENGKPKIKIYGKGDAAVCFEKELAVQQAMQWLDGSQIRPGVEISVQKAEFQVKDERVDDAEQLRMDKVQKAIKRRLDMKRQKDKFSWEEDEIISSGLKIIVLKNVFSLAEVPTLESESESFFDSLEKEIGLECQRIGGNLEKITIFRENPLGVIAIKFKSASGADKAVDVLNGRWFGGRQLVCEYFDGVTNYKKCIGSKNEDTEESTRLEEFGNWIEGQSNP